MTDHSDQGPDGKDTIEGHDYLERRREIMKKLAAGALATPAVLTSVMSKPAAASTLSSPD
jgi:hypothetical protein